jgi:hypothetical protein
MPTTIGRLEFCHAAIDQTREIVLQCTQNAKLALGLFDQFFVLPELELVLTTAAFVTSVERRLQVSRGECQTIDERSVPGVM